MAFSPLLPRSSSCKCSFISSGSFSVTLLVSPFSTILLSLSISTLTNFSEFEHLNVFSLRTKIFEYFDSGKLRLFQVKVYLSARFGDCLYHRFGLFSRSNYYSPRCHSFSLKPDSLYSYFCYDRVSPQHSVRHSYVILFFSH